MKKLREFFDICFTASQQPTQLFLLMRDLGFPATTRIGVTLYSNVT